MCPSVAGIKAAIESEKTRLAGTGSKHIVVEDFAGGGYPRLTCQTCDDKTLVRQPYMADADWERQKFLFLKEHPA